MVEGGARGEEGAAADWLLSTASMLLLTQAGDGRPAVRGALLREQTLAAAHRGVSDKGRTLP